MNRIHTRLFLITLLVAVNGRFAIAQLVAAPQTALQSKLVVVGPPKIYDDLYLRSLLSSLQNQLAAVHGIDQATLLGHIGVVQGADTRQTSVALSGSGPSTPQTSTFTLGAGVPAFSYPPGYTTPPDAGVSLPSGTATSTTPGTTTTVGSLTPTAPTPPAPSLTSPALSSLGQSSLDTYNESLQLSAEITNTALLLNGALSDALQRDGKPKTTVTIGFPVTVQAPADTDKGLAGAVAEVHVSVCSNSVGEAPSIVTLLPQERTYNVASLVDKSFLGSASAVLGGVFNVGGGFFWSHQRYYLVQQQETVAFLEPAAAPACGGQPSTAFAWQVRPVLGKEFIRPGNSVNFVQISIPKVMNGPAPTQSIGSACVSIVWRTPSPSGFLGLKKSDVYLSAGNPGETKCYDIEYYNTLSEQAKTTLSVTDIGQGAVTVKAVGTFLPGTTVRLVNTYLNPDRVTATRDTLQFTSPASAIVAAGQVYIVGRDGREIEALNPATAASVLTLGKPVIAPYSDAQSLVSLSYQAPPDQVPGDHGPGFPDPNDDPWVVVIGGKVFGLSDAPFFSKNETLIQLLVPTALLQTSSQIELRRLLWRNVGFRAAQPITANAYSKAMSSISKTLILSSSNGLTIGLTGTGLDNLMLVFPPKASTCAKCSVTPVGSTYLQVTLPKPPDPKKDAAGVVREDPKKDPDPDPTDGLKQLVFCRKGDGDACAPNYPALIAEVPKLDAPTPKPSLDKHDPIPASAKPVSVTITGAMLDQVVLIESGKLPLAFRLVTAGKPSLVVDLPLSITSVPGGYSLLVTFADKTTSAFLLTVQKAGS